MDNFEPDTNGVKWDEGKPPIGLIPQYPIEQVALALAYGSRKYGRHNWRAGLAVQRNIDAALRHVFAANEGEDSDPESGLPHLAHAICCLMFALDTVQHLPSLDDRYRAVPHGERGKPFADTVPPLLWPEFCGPCNGPCRQNWP